MNALAYVVFGLMAVGFVGVGVYMLYSQFVVWPRAQREWQEENDRLHAEGLPRNPVKLTRSH